MSLRSTELMRPRGLGLLGFGSWARLASGLVLLHACKASVQADARAGWGGQVDALETEQPSSAEDTARLDIEDEANAGETTEAALMGARHDLRLVLGQQTVSCHCLVAALGTPSNSAFAWESAAPSIDPGTQQVIAFSSDGTDCSAEPKDSLGASYWGYKTMGADVIVVVEPARQGRPVTTGAIIPRPSQGGSTYVEPLTEGIPYGRPAEGRTGRCSLEAP